MAYVSEGFGYVNRIGKKYHGQSYNNSWKIPMTTKKIIVRTFIFILVLEAIIHYRSTITTVRTNSPNSKTTILNIEGLLTIIFYLRYSSYIYYARFYKFYTGLLNQRVHYSMGDGGIWKILWKWLVLYFFIEEIHQLLTLTNCNCSFIAFSASS